MSLIENTQKKIFKRVIILALLVIGILFLTLPNPKKYVYGIIFGATINLLNFRLMSITLSKSVNMPQHKIMPYVMANYFSRYIIYGVVLAVAAMADYISLLTAILGIFMVKIIIISDTFYDTIFKRNKNKSIDSTSSNSKSK
ncbi:MAG: ATP synthase subunit I [Firmicutes bacterium]|nr:ATP synthase subunit I [Bacillota bacterium]